MGLSGQTSMSKTSRLVGRGVCAVMCFAAGAIGLFGCDGKPDATESSAPAPTDSSAPGIFTEVTSAVGLKDAPDPWPDGRYYTPEVTPGGVALLDYDNDGDLDIYHVRHPPPGNYPQAFEASAPDRLYQQQPDHSFVDVTERAGLGDPGFGHGAAAGDVDNDGDVDLYVTNYGGDRFYRNNGDGTFTEATAAAGFATSPHWSSSAAFLDYDRDGHLDLYVVRFAVFDPRRVCHEANGQRDYCGPHLFDGARDALYRNNGNGTFTDVTAASRIDHPPGRGWGIACADFTGDGWVDIFVANDEEPNHLWVNRRDGTFADEAVARGCAVNGAGGTEANMGVAVGDIDANGWLDIFSTHIFGEKNTLWSASPGGTYTDASARSKLAAPSIQMTGWGCGFFDYDHDGDLDLAVVNGRVTRQKPLPGAALGPFWSHYAEPNQLFENEGAGVFAHVSSRAGGFTHRVESTRGLAFGDIDGDGDVDLVSNAIGNILRVYRNDAPAKGSHWLMVRAMTGSRDAHGAVVTVVTGGKRITRIADPAYSYLSSNDPRAHFGLGNSAGKVDAIEVRWPDGALEHFSGTEVDRVVTVRKGDGS